MQKKTKKMILPVVLISLLSSINPVMAEDTKETVIDEVEVRSTTLSDYLVTTEVITAKKIKEMGATNLAEAINMVPGMYVSNAGKGARLVRIRGAASDQTKIYIDGIPVFPLSGIASNSASTLEQIPVGNIEKIEIIKGPGPVQYGTDYKGGVILITTKKGQGAGRADLNLSAGSHNSFNNYATYSGGDSNSNYYVTAGQNKGDGFSSNSEFDEKYFNGKIKWNLGKDSALTLSGNYMDTDREIPNSIDQITGLETTSNTKWSGDTLVGGKGNTKDWKYTGFKQTNIALQFEQQTSKRFKYDVKLYHVTDGNNLWVYNQNNATAGTNTYANPIWYRSSWHSQGNGMEFTGDLQTAWNNTITFGTKYNKIDWNADESNSNLAENGTDTRIGYFIQDNWQVNGKTNLALGVRYDQAKQSYHYFKTGSSTLSSSSTLDSTDPVFNITHQLDEQNALRFSAGKTHIFVQAKQAATNITLGLPLPEPEKATNYEVGWKHNFNDKSSLDVAAFKNKIDNRIERRSTGNKEYYNIGKTDIQGLELQYNRNLTKRLKGFVNYTYLDAQDTNASGVTSKAIKMPEGIFNYGLTYTVDKYQASVLGHVLGKVQTDNTTYTQLASYHTVDFDVQYNANKNTDYFLRINNIFDSKYWETATDPGDGINFMAGVTIKL